MVRRSAASPCATCCPDRGCLLTPGGRRGAMDLSAVLLTTALALTAAPPAPARPSADYREALAETERLEGRLTFTFQRRGDPGIEIDLSETQVADGDLKFLPRVARLRILNLFNTRISDA